MDEIVIVGDDGTEHVFPAGFDPKKAAAIVRGAPAAAGPTGVSAEKVAGAAPVLGGMIGSAVGGAPGALLGGAAGSGYGQLLRHAGEIPGAIADVSRNLFTEPAATLQGFGQGAMEGGVGAGVSGAIQGALDKGGQLVGAGLKAVAPKLADLALNPIESVAKKYPNIAETYVKVGKLVAPGSRGGVGAVGKKSSVEQAKKLTGAKRQEGDALIQAADQAGAPPAGGVGAIQELQAMRPTAQRVAKTGGVDNDPAILERMVQFTAKNPRISNVEANQMVRDLDMVTNKAQANARASGPPVGINEEMNKAVAQGLRGQIRDNVKGIEPIKAETMDLAGLTKALEKASVRKHLLTRNLGLTSGAIGLGTGLMSQDPAAGVGAGMGSLAAYYAMTNPRNLGRMALASRNLGNAAEWSPQVARLAALLSALETTEPAQ